MTTALLQELVDTKATVVPLTVEQYHRMIETGILAEDSSIELLDGFLVRKDRSATGENPMTIGHEHAFIIGKLTELLSTALPAGTCLRTQQPVTLRTDNEPEPDLVIAIGPQEAYRYRHPGPDDVLCVVEVADSSLETDRITKQRLYADNKLPHYIIVNLVDRSVELYTQPLADAGRYQLVRTFKAGDDVTIVITGHTLSLSVASLFT